MAVRTRVWNVVPGTGVSTLRGTPPRGVSGDSVEPPRIYSYGFSGVLKLVPKDAAGRPGQWVTMGEEMVEDL